VIPLPGFRIDRFAHAAPDAQRGAAGRLHEGVAFAHQGAQRSRRGVEDGDVPFIADLPEAAVVGIVGHPFEHQGRRAIRERTIDDIAVAGDPADVGRTPIDFAGPVIEHLRMGHRRPEQIAARAVQDALGRAGGTGGVEDEQRVFRAHSLGRAVRRGGIAGWAVEEVTPFHHRHIRAGALDDDDGFDRGAMGECRIDIGLQGHSLTTAQPFVGGDDQAGVAVANAAGEAVGRESAEHDRMDRADAGAGQHGEGGFGDHRQIERHPVATADSLCF